MGAEFEDAINKYSSFSTLGPDHISWNYFKGIVDNAKCITNIINIANFCINLGYWSLHFKKSLTIIIPKPNKSLYNTPKTFCPIILLNMIGKLIEKVISNRLQVHSIASNFIYPNQLEGIEQHSTTDAGIFLTHLIWAGWMKGFHTSTLVFNITQFFSSLNHQLLLLILNKAGFDSKIFWFFSSYLINRQTQYVWNYFTSLFFSQYWYWSEIYTLSYSFSSLYYFYLPYIQKKN